MNGGSQSAREQAAGWLEPLQNHLSDAGLGHISEIFEGDAPHRPCGCMAQAWSVAEVLRSYAEDVKGMRQDAKEQSATTRDSKTSGKDAQSLPVALVR